MSQPVMRQRVGDYEIIALPVLTDNFSYLITTAGKAILIDAGEAEPVLAFLAAEELQLVQVLITHHHADHTAGCRAAARGGVLSRSPSVAAEETSYLSTPCRVMATPGHTRLCKSFYFPALDALFSGDALINGGCGRVMEGSAAMLCGSLQQIATLPEQTRLFGGHDYLLDNLDFAKTEGVAEAPIEERRKRYAADPGEALFMSLAEERKTNPFCDVTPLRRLHTCALGKIILKS